jgi:glycine cleavage system T protein
MRRNTTMALTAYGDVFFGKGVDEIDPVVHELIKREEERQNRKIILIPSESLCPLPVRQALGSVFSSIYAEGYPPKSMTLDPEERIEDMSHQLAYYRRYGDRRFYKGCDYVHFVETLAQRRIAGAFANRRARAGDIFVNVQPLAGAAANNAVYEAFVKPGDTVMGMSLSHGGHLTHGSEFNRSGKWHKIVSYEVDRQTERLDYEAILRLVQETHPKMIIAGFTSYPWAPDWTKLREIADSVGAMLLADISHTAGMALAGVYPNPVGVSDVTTFTTHKTLFGPRGAVIMTTDEEKAQKIDTAVFPGEQGGPHVNKFAAMAVAFQIARTKPFRDLQKRIVENAGILAGALAKRGIRLAYGGTDTHLLVIDLNAVKTPTGFPLKGEIAARVLDLCGLVVNKNTIPGDATAADASGIRLGTPWVTQRGMGYQEMERLADMIDQILTHIHPFHYEGLTGTLPRGKIDLVLLEDIKREVAQLADQARREQEVEKSGYPYYTIQWGGEKRRRLVLSEDPTVAVDAVMEAVETEAALLDLSDLGIVEVRGDRALPFLDQVISNNIRDLSFGSRCHGVVLDREGAIIDDVAVIRLDRDEWERDRYWVLTNPDNTERIKSWFRGISDGYVLFDEKDIFMKVEGPVVVEDLAEVGPLRRMTALGLCGPAAGDVLSHIAPDLETIPPGGFWGGQIAGTEVVVSRSREGNGLLPVLICVPTRKARSLWRYILDRGGKPNIRSGGRRVWDGLRRQKGLPQYGRQGVDRDGITLFEKGGQDLFDLSKPYFVGQWHFEHVRPKIRKKEFTYEEPEMPLRRSCLYEEHRKLTRRIVPFAGWEMPVWYTSIAEEHRAVRETAGLFDTSHMGVFEISGDMATPFLDLAVTNYVRWIKDGECQYAYLVDPDGRVIDDIMIYRHNENRYMMVVNAVNAEKDMAWLRAIQSGEFLLVRDHPGMAVPGPVTIRDLKEPSSGADQRVDLALQGPNSLEILKGLLRRAGERRKLSRLSKMHFMKTETEGLSLMVARTGYTGERVGFEIFVHPDKAPLLWNTLLKKGSSFDIKPAGLGARDSTRIEAGLPLYGHELAGPLDISPTDAGFAPYVKYHKPCFIGREALLKRDEKSSMQISRFRVLAKGIRMIKTGAPVINRRSQQLIGTVTSCALDTEGFQVGLALLDRRNSREGTRIGVFPEAGDPSGERGEKPMGVGQKIALHEEAVVISRFPEERLHIEQFRRVLEK